MGASRGRLAYLDHAATTPTRPEVLEAMMPFLTTAYGNASAGHSLARTARRAVDDARDVLAEALGGEPGEVVFTSGGTEADNLAVTGAVIAAREATGRALVACSAVEHPAVLEPVRAAGGVELAVDSFGRLDLAGASEWLASAPEEVTEVSLMLVNNETGAIEPVGELAAITRELAPEAVVHTDAVQGLGWIDVAKDAAGADLVSVSAHKIGGPKGAGALLVRSAARKRMRPILRGGPQERELRAGTLDVAGIVGLAEAARLSTAEREQETNRVACLAERFVADITSAVGGCGTVVPPQARVPGICLLHFAGVLAEELLLVLDDLGVCASAGSACASGAIEPSHVLLAMGRNPAEAREHVRFSLGHTTTAADTEQAVAAVAEGVARLRGS
jgi:cysteine desulfurase